LLTAAMLGSLLTKWTIRLALACLVAYFAGQMLAGGSSRETPAAGKKFTWPWISRWIWTVGCGLFVAHVVCAFQFTHHWSHAHAWEHTDQETQRLMGFSFGDGIYFSYFFLLLWVADVACLWLAVSRPIWLMAAAYLFMFFIAFNGAIVFEDGPTRPVGIVVMLLLLPVIAVFVARHASRLFGRKDQLATTAEVEA
jgi:hypothetical protein